MDNFYPPNLSDVGFVDLAGGNYRLADVSPYKGAGTDGKDVGADIDDVEAATCGAIDGTYCPSGGISILAILVVLVILAAVAATLIVVAIARRRRRRTE